MRASRRSFRLLLAALALCCSARSSRAQLVIVTPADDPEAVAHAELGYAQGDGTPVTWLSLRLQRGPAALIAALPNEAVVESGLDAWFMALEATASPNILLPSSATDCGKTSSYVHVSWPRDFGTPATELMLRTPADVSAMLDEAGLAAPSELPIAARYLVWSWPKSDAALTTRTLRIVGGATPLTLRPGAPFPLLVSSVTRGPKLLSTELSNSELRVTFVAGTPSSDYGTRLRDWLQSRAEPLVETRASGPLFDWSIYADTVSLRPLSESYAQEAESELPSFDADTCAKQLRQLREPGAPNAAACGDAVDLSLALAATGPEQPTLQRFVISGAIGVDPSALADGGDPSTPVLRATSLDGSACVVDAPPPIVLDPPARGGGSASGTDANTTVVVEQTVVVDETPADGGCSCTAGSDPYYDDRDTIACSSDTSSAYESNDDACAGDSSTASDDSGCGSDSRNSSSSDTSCDGGSEDSSYDGDTCTGSGAPGAERSSKAQASLVAAPRAARPRRMKTSLWSLAVAAVVLPIRRRNRRQIARG
jgi:hypothetical protein